MSKLVVAVSVGRSLSTTRGGVHLARFAVTPEGGVVYNQAAGTGGSCTCRWRALHFYRLCPISKELQLKGKEDFRSKHPGGDGSPFSVSATRGTRVRNIGDIVTCNPTSRSVPSKPLLYLLGVTILSTARVRSSPAHSGSKVGFFPGCGVWYTERRP